MAHLYRKSQIPEHLQKYFQPAEMGLEPTPDEFVKALVAVFNEVHRVLRNDGTLWLNLGDSYASFRDGKATPDTTRGNSTGTLVDKGKAINRMASTFTGTSIKHKDLIGIPWRVAFALQAEGWYLRQDIIWHKPNPMPESVRDRCTKSHEYIFLLSKKQNYYFDSEAIREPIGHGELRNKRSVWSINTQPFSGAHFATFPPDLIEPCILAGCPKGGVVLDPFGGSGTTGAVALNNDRKAILCELNPDYVSIIPERIKSVYTPLPTSFFE